MSRFEVTVDSKRVLERYFQFSRIQEAVGDPALAMIFALYKAKHSSLSRDPFVWMHIEKSKWNLDISRLVSHSEARTLLSDYPAVIYYCFTHIQHNRSTALNVPDILVKLCLNLSHPISNSKVYVPFAGSGEFAYPLVDRRVSGFETNEMAWALSKILLESVDIKNDVKLIGLRDNFPQENTAYDYIFSFPPILSGKDGVEIASYLYNLLENNLAEKGELYFVLPMSFCWDNVRWEKVRKLLVESPRNFSTTVISLPPVMEPISRVNLCLLCVKAYGDGLITLMDASGNQFYSVSRVEGTRQYDFNLTGILQTLSRVEKRFVWKGVPADLWENYNMQPSRYLVDNVLPKVQEGEILAKLMDIVELVSTKSIEQYAQLIQSQLNFSIENIDEDEVTPEQKILLMKYHELEKGDCALVDMKQLSSSYLSCDIYQSNAPVVHTDHPHFLIEDCLLLYFKDGLIKVGRTQGVTIKSPVCLQPGIIAFKLTTAEVLQDYLLRELLSDLTKNVAKKLAHGTVVTSLSKDDFLRLPIILPNLNRQREICTDDFRVNSNQADALLEKTFREFREDMHMKKHAIGQTIFNLTNWWDVLQSARVQGNGVLSDNAIIGKTRKFTISDVYDNLQTFISQLQKQIETLDRGNGMEVKTFALTDFLESYISKYQNTLFSYEYSSSRHHASKENLIIEADDEIKLIKSPVDGNKIKEGDPFEYVNFAPDALKLVLDNIISNACCHGFENRHEQKNIVFLDFKEKGDNIILFVGNNGHPLNAQLSATDVFTYAKSSKFGMQDDHHECHFGIGGYEIKNLMHEFGGDVEILSNPTEDFPVVYKLTLPKVDISSVEL